MTSPTENDNDAAPVIIENSQLAGDNQEGNNENNGTDGVAANDTRSNLSGPDQTKDEIPRIYIGNLDYTATEDELFEFLKEYDVISVLVPSHTVRGFLSSHVRPLGIAYAEFEDVEKAKKVAEVLNNKPFKNRKLKVKLYKPFTPNNVLKPKKNKANGRQRRLSALRRYKKEEPKETKIEKQDITKSKPQITQPTSIDTVYCGYLPKTATDSDLREHFKEYNPQEIWIFRTRTTKGPRHLQIHRHYTAALITLSTTESIDTISEESSKRKLLNKIINVKPAYLSKIQEVRRIAEQNGLVEPNEILNPNNDVESGEPAVPIAPIENNSTQPDEVQPEFQGNNQFNNEGSQQAEISVN